MRLRQSFLSSISGPALAALIVLVLSTVASATVHNGTLNGDEAQATTCSIGSGAQVLGTVTYDDVSGLFSWSYTYGSNAPNFDDGTLFAGSPAILAHFHSAAPIGVVGTETPITLGGASPNSGSETISPAMGAEVLAELWYVNLHSIACGGGEIRGQVIFPPPVPSVSYPLGGALLLLLCGIAFFAVRRTGTMGA